MTKRATLPSTSFNLNSNNSTSRDLARLAASSELARTPVFLLFFSQRKPEASVESVRPRSLANFSKIDRSSAGAASAPCASPSESYVSVASQTEIPRCIAYGATE